MNIDSFSYAGEISALLTACMWAGSSFIFASASHRIGSLLVNLTRLILAVFLLSLTILIAGLDLHISQSQFSYLSVSGLIGLAFGDTFLFKAYRQIGARLSMLVMSLAPAIAALAAFVFLGERLSFLGIAGIGVTLAGITVVVLERHDPASTHHRMTAKGFFYSFCAACGQAGGLLFAKQAFNEGMISGFVAAFFRVSVSIVFLIFLAVFTRSLKHPVETLRRESKAFTLIGYGTILGPYLGITLSLFSVAHTEVGIAATLMATVPIIMLPMSRTIHREQLSWKAILGAFTAVGGVALLFLH